MTLLTTLEAKEPKLSVAMGVIQDFGEFVRKNKPDLLAAFLEMLEPFGAEIAGKYGS